MLGTIFSWGGGGREREREREREEAIKKIYIYIYVCVCVREIVYCKFENKIFLEKTVLYKNRERERERAYHFLTWAAYILRLRDKLYN